jgi:hypothetical protein
MDRNGEFERVIVYDDNFCYDSSKTSPKTDDSGVVDSTQPFKNLKDTGIEKTTISVTDVYETDPADTVDVTALSGFDATVVGCAAKQVAQQ